jgi:hypothetical protein
VDLAPIVASVVLSASLATTAISEGQTANPPIPGTDRVSISFPADKKTITVPMQLLGDVPAIEVQVRGRPGKNRFVIDTGSSYTLMDSAVAKQLGLSANDKGYISGAGSGRIAVDLVSGVDLDIAGLTSSGHKVVLTDLSGIGDILGSAVAGIIGYDFLSKVVVTLDYPSKQVVFQPRGSFMPQSDAEVVPIRFKRRWIYVPMIVKVAGHAEVKDDFFVDTGSADDVNHPLIKQSSSPVRETRTGVGLGSATQGVVGTLEYAQLGSFRIERVSSSCCSSNPDTHRQVGSGFLKHFAITFDYAAQRLTISKPK